jgi:hypothetical protein
MSIEHLQQALKCLYFNQPPKEGELEYLGGQEWEALSDLLLNLLKEKEHSRVH